MRGLKKKIKAKRKSEVAKSDAPATPTLVKLGSTSNVASGGTPLIGLDR